MGEAQPHYHESQSVLDVSDLRTYFETEAGIVRAVDGVTFHVAPGETLGLVGESGSGKSVTALSIMRLVPTPPGRIVSGAAVLDGDDLLQLTDTEIKALRGNKIAMIFQDPMTSLNPVLTIGQQLVETLHANVAMEPRAAKRRALELLRLVGIPAADRRLNDYPHQFSGGMRQRVMIAMALSCNPKLVLADEITTALDVTIQAQILDLLRRLATESQTAFVLITHDLGIVAGLTQRVHVMYAGRIVERSRTEELFRNPLMPYTWGLLGSIPRLDAKHREKLIPIEGMPPDLTEPATGCRFEPRCRFRREICRMREPDLLPVGNNGPEHDARCWGTQNVPGGGWLIGTKWRDRDADIA